MKTLFTLMLSIAFFFGYAQNNTDQTHSPEQQAPPPNIQSLKLKHPGWQMITGGAVIAVTSGAFLALTHRPATTSYIPLKAGLARTRATAVIGIGIGAAVAIIGYTKLRKAGISIKGNTIAINID